MKFKINNEDMLHQQICLKPFATALGIFERVRRVCVLSQMGDTLNICCN